MGLFYNLKSAILKFFGDIRIYKGGFILFGESSYQVKGPDMRAIIEHIKPGDVLLRRYNNYLSSLFIAGHFSHAAIYIGDNRVLHMMADGMVDEDILTFMRCDDVAILRFVNATRVAAAITQALNFKLINVKYDYNFDTSCPKRLYCTELIDICFGYPVRSVIGYTKIIIPDHFLNSRSFLTIWSKKRGK